MGNDSLIGTQLGAYRIQDKLGEGGMAEVYKAYDPRLLRDVAIKVVLPEIAEQAGFRQRFEQEIRLSAQLEHHNIVRVYDVGQSGNLTYLVMQYVGGGALRDQLRSGRPLEPRKAAQYALQMARALHFAHTRGIIHRDVKPQNMLVSANDPNELLLSDFGIAKLFDASKEDTIIPLTSSGVAPRFIVGDSQGLTNVGQMVGTAEYMAPEQINMQPVDARTDVYALGVVLFQMLTGQTPFQSGSVLGLLYQHIHTVPPSVRELNPTVPEMLAHITAKALAKAPDARFQSADEMTQALEAVLAAPSASNYPFTGAGEDYSIVPLPSANLPADVAPPPPSSSHYGQQQSTPTAISVNRLGLPRTADGDVNGGSLAATPTSLSNSSGRIQVLQQRAVVPAPDPTGAALPLVSRKIARPSRANRRTILLTGLTLLVIASGIGLFSLIHANQVANATTFDSLLVAIGGFLARYAGIALSAIGGFLGVYFLLTRLLLPIASSLRTAITSSNDKTVSSIKPADIPTAPPTSTPSLLPTFISPPPPQPTQSTIPQAPDQKEQSVQSAATATYRPQWRPPEEPINTWTPTQAEGVVPGSSTVMISSVSLPSGELKDFFISYTRTNFAWAAWIAQQLEEAGYSILLPPWGLRSDSDFEMEMQKATAKAKRIIAVLSPTYLNTLNAQSTWIDTFKMTTTTEPNTLIPIRVQECGSKFRNFLESINHIDIVGEDEAIAQAMLLAGIHGQGVKLTVKVSFPGSALHQMSDKEAGSPKRPITTRRKRTEKSADQTTTEFESPPPGTKTTLRQQKEANAKLASIEKDTEPVKPQPAKGIKIFFSYSHKDKDLRDRLDNFLRPLQHEGLITSWHDGKIEPGREWPKEIEEHLSTASIILLLVSSNFLASDYCYSVEMKQAVARHEAGEARVIPVILSHADWHNAPFGKLQALPRNARPVTDWSKRDKAFLDIVTGIRKAVEELRNK